MGFGRRAIERGIAAGRLNPVYRGVYAVGHRRLVGRGRWMAAVLACGPGALASHGTAVALRDLLPTRSSNVDVTVPARTGRSRRRGITLHRATLLHPDDRTTIDGIPVTSLARTLLDYAEVANADRLARAIEEAERREVLDMRAIDALRARSDGRRGLKPLDAALAIYRPSAVVIRSKLERRFLRICREADLPAPAMNAWVLEYEVDAFWAEYGLAVELDSRTHHETRAAFQRDRERDRALQLAGLGIVRFTSNDLEDAAAIERTVVGLLALRGYERNAGG
jgi:hypothetical protein